jgi:hypothetical protein
MSESSRDDADEDAEKKKRCLRTIGTYQYEMWQM